MLFSAAALFFSAQENAFAHPNHVHAVQAQSAAVVEVNVATPITDHVIHTDEFVSSAELPIHKCQHGNSQSDCDSCCACSASASVAIATPDTFAREITVRSERLPLAAAYLVRQTVLDLSRPPKTFA